MSFKATPWSYLVRFEPARAKTKILAAYKRAGGNAVKASVVLGLSHRSLTRIVTALELTAAVDKVRAAAGYGWTSKSGRRQSTGGAT
jgi:hypothetical protein